MRKVNNLLKLAVVLAVVLVLPISAFALAKTSENSVIVAEDEVINDDYYVVSDQSVTIEGVVNGDVYAASDRVTIRGTVNGDVFAAGRLIEITGVVEDDVRVAGSTISITSSAKIGDSLSAAGSDVTIGKEVSVGGAIQAAGATINIDGSVERGIVAGGERVSINNSVGGDVYVDSETLSFDRDASVEGKVKTLANNVNIDENAELASKPEQVKDKSRADLEGAGLVGKLAGTIVAFSMALLSGVIILLVSRRHSQQIAQTIHRKPGAAIGYGFITIFAAIPMALALMVTLVGLPIGLIVLALWLIGLYVAKIFSSITLAQMVYAYLNKKNKKSKQLSLFGYLASGLALYYLLSLIPIVGFLATSTLTAAGLGGIVIEISRVVKKQSK